MCGIVGHNRLIENNDYILSLHHRGPDNNEVVQIDDFTFGHTRLSILDLNEISNQPMSYKELTITYNGEVYNYQEIRQELESYGYEFLTNGDTEVILKSFHHWREKCVDKFVGMFAFGIYDNFTKEVYLFRDRAGVKPLYYHIEENKIIFSSEVRVIKQILKSAEISRKAVYSYFKFGYINDNISIFENVFKLPPASYLYYKNGHHKIIEYWGIDNLSSLQYKGENDYIDALEDLLISAFSYRMVSDVPIGVFLSGGVDSSLVTAILKKHYGEIDTFTIGFHEKKYDESIYAKEIGNYFKTNHHEKILDLNKARDIIHELPNIYDEPFGDSSSLATYLVSHFARENNIKVVLSADGGDELFCGYSRYFYSNDVLKKIEKIPNTIKSLSKHLRKTPYVKGSRYEHILDVLSKENREDVYVALTQNTKDYELRGLFKNTFSNEATMDSKNMYDLMMKWDFKNYLSEDILVKVDRATMSNSIESREPFLDHRVIEFAYKLPLKYKVKNNTGKTILKKVLERYIPKKMYERPKQGFGVPIEYWLNKDLLELITKYITRDRLEEHGLFNYTFVQKEIENLKQKRKINHNMIWYLLVFQMWYEKWGR